MRDWRVLLPVTFSLLVLLTSTPHVMADVEDEGAAQLESWTFMIYMAADVTDTLPWEADINEMEAADQAENANIIVLVDPPGMANTMLLKIEHDDNHFDPEIVSTTIDDLGEVIPGGGEVNTGSPAVLRDFILFSATEYPADRLVLVLWGHGAGWRGLCPDGTDLLTLPELGAALAMAEATLDRRLDMLVLDVCNGATMELAYEISEHADFLVGSELNVPAEGLPYADVFNAFSEDPWQSTNAFGEAIVDSYVEWAEYGSSHATVACLLDLSRVDDTVEALDSMSELGLIFNRLYHSAMTAAVHSSEHCEDEWSVDFGALCGELCAEDLPIEVKVASMDAAREYLLAVKHYAETNTDELDGATTTGLSLYCPSSVSDTGYLELRISQTLWTNLSFRLHEDIALQAQGPGPELTLGDSSVGGENILDFATLTWNPDAEWNYTSYMVNVFRIEPNGLVACQTILAVNPVIRIMDVIGDLWISASGCIGGEAYSNHLRQCTLSRLVTVEVIVSSLPETYDGDIGVMISSDINDFMIFRCEDNVCTVLFTAPDWANIGGIVTLRLIDLTNRNILSEQRTLVSGEDMVVTLNVHMTTAETIESEILLGFVAMITILCVAAVVYVNLLRRR
ncbi:MAG TPA: clostripain-related cysteine peptidase [Thermoplasmata archaeon]|nr:clostripain-related cysteine peptidase [Thermoplasmata archaeon]